MSLPENFNLESLAIAFTPYYSTARVVVAIEDSGYREYVFNHHLLANHLIKNYLSKQIDTKGKWFDVLFCSTYDTKRYGLLFNFIVVDVFERKVKPVYTPDCSPDYLTWRTALEDITRQRKAGVKPKTLFIMPVLSPPKGTQVVYFNDMGSRYKVKNNSEEAEFKYTGELPSARTFRAKCVVEIKNPTIKERLVEHGYYLSEEFHNGIFKPRTFKDVVELLPPLEPIKTKNKPSKKKVVATN